MEYNEYLNTWLEGLMSEIGFWKKYMETPNEELNKWQLKTMTPNRKFELEDDIPKSCYGKKYFFADVGSGPFSRCGIDTKLVDLSAISIDPLAVVYTELKKTYKRENGIDVQTGFFELLDSQYEENSFDMVHASNSLDHCYDAIMGLYQLLRICKVGGKVILRHSENEAENENYCGLHQWNLSLHNKENSFVIWRQDKRYNICSLFKEYADFELQPDVCEKGGNWIHNKVIITKKKDIRIPTNNYKQEMLTSVYEYMTQFMYDVVCVGYESSKQLKTQKILNDMERIKNNEKFKQFCDAERNSKIIIYGYGRLGRKLEKMLFNNNISVYTIFDQYSMDDSIISYENYSVTGDESVVVIAVAQGCEEIKRRLLKRGFESSKLISIEQFNEKFC